MSPTRTKTRKKGKAAAAEPAAKRDRAKRGTRKGARSSAQQTVETYAPLSSNDERELVLTWFRLLARCRGAWLQNLWMNDSSIHGRATVTHAEVAGILDDQDSPKAELEWSRQQEPIVLWRAQADEIRNRIGSDKESRFARLVQLFNLQPEELDLLILCSAVAFDPSLSRVCAYLQDHSGRTYLTEQLAGRLLAMDRPGKWTPEMNAFHWELIQRRETGVNEPEAVICDEQIKDWLVGNNSLDDTLVGVAKFVEPKDGKPLPEWPVKSVSDWIEECLRHDDSQRIRIIVIAPRGGGRKTFASATANRLGQRLLVVDSASVDDANWQRLFIRAQRQAILEGAALAWTGDGALRRPWVTNQSPFPIQFILCEPGKEPTPSSGVIDREVHLPMPEPATRERLWRESSEDARDWPDDEVRELSEHHSVWPGDIKQASLLGPRNPVEAGFLVRQAARSRFGNLAQILETPFTADDLVLPAGVKRVLETIAFEAEDRIAFWQQQEPRRLFPQGRGLIALFSGPSGTGKTMAAQVIAAQLNQDLCRVNIAQLVSKWVGETPKNVEQVIRVAAENNVVLYFDEADALFAKRSAEIRDAQDKFANTDTAFLLQAIEGYPGIAILATNLKSNIDLAFLRRIRYLVQFPRPDAVLRRTLWTKLVKALAGEKRAEKLAPAFELLSTTAEATGAQIKFAVLAGLFAARAEQKALSPRHLVIGMDRELAKEGRAISPRERDMILKLEAAR